MSDPVVDAFRAVLASSSPSVLATWAATGPAGVRLLRDELGDRPTIEAPASTHPRDVLDNLAAATTAIARSSPDPFLDAFDGPEWAANTFVLDGLGAIDDERATARLIAAARLPDASARMHAALGLGGRSSDTGSAALGRLVGDPDDLVRYHALESLARVGTTSALPDLDGFRPHNALERTLRDAAIAAIVRRGVEAAPTD